MTFQLEQDVDTIEFMSMNINTKDVYQDFNSDYGVLVGRVIANGGVGIPNAKISIFIPLDDTDAQDGTIASIYPYKTPRDKNAQGKRYNLLPRVSEFDTQTGTFKPNQPFGSFPIKPEIVTNVDFLGVYKKYYKYTALTNSAGDYMIFGVPIGVQTVHLSVDITDIGKYSMTPAAMVTNLGYSPNLFTDNNTKIKPSDDLTDLPNIETQEITTEVIPFWGDTTNFIIGITRQDFRIRSVLTNTFVLFGSVFTDGGLNSMWGSNHDPDRSTRELYYINGEGNFNISIQSKRAGIVTEKIYYYPASVTDAQIDSGNVDPKTQMILLSPTEYSVYKRNGDFAAIISCNRNKIITDDFGNEVSIPDSSADGIFTKFRGFMTLELTPDAVPMNFTGDIGPSTTLTPFRYTLKFPQHANAKGHSFRQETDTSSKADTTTWRKEHFTFSGGGFYSISRFHGTVINSNHNESENYVIVDGFSAQDHINVVLSQDQFFTTGVIQTNDDASITGNTKYQMIPNTYSGGKKLFGANWLNLSVHMPQVGYLVNGYSYVNHWRSNSNFSQEFYQNTTFYYEDNAQIIAGNQFNTKWFARSDLHWTDIITVPREDILAMAGYAGKGFTNANITGLKGKYRNGSRTPTIGNWSTPCPINGGKVNAAGTPSSAQDTTYYYYKGFDTANCIEFIISLGLI